MEIPIPVVVIAVLAIVFLSVYFFKTQGNDSVDKPSAAPAPDPVDFRTGDYQVVLLDSGLKKIAVIKSLRALTNADLVQAKDWSDRTPCSVLKNVDVDTAAKAVAELKSSGASAEYRKYY